MKRMKRQVFTHTWQLRGAALESRLLRFGAFVDEIARMGLPHTQTRLGRTPNLLPYNQNRLRWKVQALLIILFYGREGSISREELFAEALCYSEKLSTLLCWYSVHKELPTLLEAEASRLAAGQQTDMFDEDGFLIFSSTHLDYLRGANLLPTVPIARS